MIIFVDGWTAVLCWPAIADSGQPLWEQHIGVSRQIILYNILYSSFLCEIKSVSKSTEIFCCLGTAQQTQNIFITFVQGRPNGFDVGPTLYKCYTNVLSWLGGSVNCVCDESIESLVYMGAARNADQMLGQRRRRWINISSALGQRIVPDGYILTVLYRHSATWPGGQIYVWQ